MEVEVGSGRQGAWSWPWVSGQSAQPVTLLPPGDDERSPVGETDHAADVDDGAAAAAAAPPSSESAAVAAERHRLTSSNVEQLVDLPALATTLAQMLPYFIMLSSLFVFQFSSELLQLLWLTYVQWTVNREIRWQVSRKKDLQLQGLTRTASIVGMAVLGFLLLTDWAWLLRGALLLPPLQRSSTVATALRVLILDAFVRLLWTFPKLSVLVAFKIACGMGPGAKCSNAAASRVQGRLLITCEHVLLLYRSALPVQLWYSYLLHSSDSTVLSSALTGVYLVLKIGDVKHQWLLMCTAARIALRGGASWGTYVGAAPHADAGAQEQAAVQRTSQPVQRRRQLALSPVLMSLAASLPVRWQQQHRQQEQEQQQQQQHSAATNAAAATEERADVEGGLSGPPTDGTCPVCHDTVTVGVRLDCSHVFCEDCICEWLERHRTCPMCRVEIKPPGLTTHGDGASSLLPVLF